MISERHFVALFCAAILCATGAVAQDAPPPENLDREIGVDGRATRAVGSTVDVGSATYTNTIGDALLGAFWEDPDFDPSRRAFYYVRVLEIPTPTWIAYDEQVFGPRDAPDEALRVHQERAYTSPIWYTP